MKKKAYLLGDMLKMGSQMRRAYEKEQLEKLENIEIFSPQEQKDINDKSKNPTAEKIFAKDTGAILESNIIVCDADNDSVGSTTEIGMIWGLNYMLNSLWNIIETSEDDHDIAAGVALMLNAIPVKKVYWHSTDIRNTDIPESGMRRSFSINQFLYGCLLEVSGEQKTFEEIIEELKGLE